MPVFSYKARNGSGASVNGVLEAISEDDLLKKLQALNYMPVHVGLDRAASSGKNNVDISGQGRNLEMDCKGRIV